MRRKEKGLAGRVVRTRGRRVVVADADGERTCFLSGQRAVVGDDVLWVPARGEGGKIIDVLKRRTVLKRVGPQGREQVLAANLQGLLVVAAAQNPPFRAGLVDRYCVAAGVSGLELAVVLNKCDLGVEEQTRAEITLRQEAGVRSLEVSAHTGQGLDELRAFLRGSEAPWALVGHSGVGKTSLVGALLPEQDVGEIGDISEYWGTGQHTTTGSRIFGLPHGGEIMDSPGIRTFAPGGIGAEDVRRHFPGLQRLQCQYRDCLHRPGEEGCVAEDEAGPELVKSYRRLLAELQQISQRRRR